MTAVQIPCPTCELGPVDGCLACGNTRTVGRGSAAHLLGIIRAGERRPQLEPADASAELAAIVLLSNGAIWATHGALVAAGEPDELRTLVEHLRARGYHLVRAESWGPTHDVALLERLPEVDYWRPLPGASNRTPTVITWVPVTFTVRPPDTQRCQVCG